jgi:hypothetical protein
LDVNSFLLDVVLPGSDLCFNPGRGVAPVLFR